MSATSTTIIHKDHHHIVRERVFAVSDYERVMLLIHEERITGTLSLDLRSGGIATIRLREEKKITPQ